MRILFCSLSGLRLSESMELTDSYSPNPLGINRAGSVPMDIDGKSDQEMSEGGSEGDELYEYYRLLAANQPCPEYDPEIVDSDDAATVLTDCEIEVSEASISIVKGSLWQHLYSQLPLNPSFITDEALGRFFTMIGLKRTPDFESIYTLVVIHLLSDSRYDDDDFLEGYILSDFTMDEEVSRNLMTFLEIDNTEENRNILALVVLYHADLSRDIQRELTDEFYEAFFAEIDIEDTVENRAVLNKMNMHFFDFGGDLENIMVATGAATAA